MADHAERKEQDGSSVAKTSLIPRDWNPVEGFDPRTGRKRELYVTDDVMDAVGHKALRGATLELAQTVLDTVKGECLVSAWGGVTSYDSEQGDTDWTVYVARPGWRFRNSGQKVKPWKGEELFLVFVDGDWVIRWWKWEQPSHDNPQFPIGHELPRFKEQLL